MTAANRMQRPGTTDVRSAGQAGFTLPEVLIAITLLTVAVIGVGAAMTVQSGGIASGAATGLAAVTRANQVATATMLAQEQIERMKARPYSETGPVDQLVAANFPAEGYGTLAGYPNFRRLSAIQADTPRVGAKTVAVQVFFRPPTESGLAGEESVEIRTIIARRP
jgi:prepilin-type N-terminal cleavage/methylation domain-containing protein